MPAVTPLQKKGVETILAKVQHYLDARYQQVRRINPKVEAVWEDLQWQLMTSLRFSVTNDKAIGPVRFPVVDLLLGDDPKKKAELFMRKSQNCLQGEIVEEKEKDTHRTSGTMEIHDMRTFCHAIDPSLETVATLIQSFIWWDLEDAADWARFERKIGIVAAFEEKPLTEEMLDYYREQMMGDHKPTGEDVIMFELRNARKALDSFRMRRHGEPGFQMIVKREATQADNPELLIDAIAGQQNLMRQLRKGGPLDEGVKDQFARAMNIDKAQLTPDKAVPFLENMIAGNKKRLRNALSGTGSGNPVNLKRQQVDEFEAKLAEAAKGRNVGEPSATG